tara:strand:- start:485 stop:598 length:114 start_codon:yes stop_codon:yes gene_type:complete
MLREKTSNIYKKVQILDVHKIFFVVAFSHTNYFEELL